VLGKEKEKSNGEREAKKSAAKTGGKKVGTFRGRSFFIGWGGGGVVGRGTKKGGGGQSKKNRRLYKRYPAKKCHISQSVS